MMSEGMEAGPPSKFNTISYSCYIVNKSDHSSRTVLIPD